MLTFLTPAIFDALVIAVVVVGLAFAMRRIYQDLRRGPRWPDTPSATTTTDKPDQQEDIPKSTTPS